VNDLITFRGRLRMGFEDVNNNEILQLSLIVGVYTLCSRSALKKD